MTAVQVSQRQWSLSELPLNSRNRLALQGEAAIPFTVLIGSAHSPAVAVIAGIHGDEYEGPAVIHELAATVNPGALRGSLLLVPVANPAAFACATRRHPADGADLNRAFPGNPEGSPTERLAYLIFQQFVLGNQFLISLHGWSKEATVLPYIEYPDADGRTSGISRAAAQASGFPYVHPYRWPVGLMCAAAVREEIPAVEAEVGGLGSITPAGQRIYRDTILRILAHAGLLASVVDPAPAAVVIDHREMRASTAGLFRSTVELGQRVVSGDEVGTISALSGQTLEVVRASRSGFLGLLRVLASVQAGDLLAHIFFEREAE